VESEEELELIQKIAARSGKRAPISIRVNPDVDAGTHKKITTGTSANKFGIPFRDALAMYQRASRMPNITIRGVQMHIGSQITQVAPFVSAVKKMLPLVRQLKSKYHLEFFDVGGGLGIVYHPALQSGPKTWWSRKGKVNELMTAQTYAESLVPLLEPLGMKILLEPGRFIVGNAGALLTQVLYVKKNPAKNFVIVDAAMNDLIRPAFYDAHHDIAPLRRPAGSRRIKADVVGPICESGDFLAQDRKISATKRGDYLAFLSAGAYGFTMSSNYNSRPRAAEVLVDGSEDSLLRRRESLDQLIALELPEY